MKVRPGCVVTFEYVLRVDGCVEDSTPPGEPIAILHGHGYSLPPGLEDALVGLSTGYLRAVVPLERAAGPFDPEKVTTVNRADFPLGAVLEVGEQFYLQDDGGRAVAVRVIAVEGDRVTVDANAPFAGKTLEYEGWIHGVREATAEEMDHGHVHGEGGTEH